MLRRRITLVTALAGLLAANLLLARLPWASLAAAYQENSALEYAQLALTALAALVALRRVASAPDEFGRRLFAALALALLAITYREADFRAWISPGSPLHQLSYLLKYVIFPACYGYLLWLLLDCLRREPPRLLRFVFSGVGVLLPLAMGLVLLAAALDKGLLDLAVRNRLLEEVLELNAYALLLFLVVLGEGPSPPGCRPAQGCGTASPQSLSP
ncbi:MAG: hypothetical protein ACX93N_02720 [Pseudohaliea sp.]